MPTFEKSSLTRLIFAPCVFFRCNNHRNGTQTLASYSCEYWFNLFFHIPCNHPFIYNDDYTVMLAIQCLYSMLNIAYYHFSLRDRSAKVVCAPQALPWVQAVPSCISPSGRGETPNHRTKAYTAPVCVNRLPSHLPPLRSVQTGTLAKPVDPAVR